MPTPGDKVARIDGQIDSSDGNKQYSVSAAEYGIVIEIDEDGDFRLCDPRGELSGWRFKRDFKYIDIKDVSQTRDPVAQLQLDGLIQQAAAAEPLQPAKPRVPLVMPAMGTPGIQTNLVKPTVPLVRPRLFANDQTQQHQQAQAALAQQQVHQQLAEVQQQL